MREATNDYNGSRRILVTPEFADAVAADFEQRRRPRPHCRRAENTTPNGSKARRICPGDSGHGCPPPHLEIVDRPPADEAADTSFATDQPSKARAEWHWMMADIAALAISGRALKNARGDTPIAKTLDRDLGLVARDLANLRATGHASGDLETQCLGGRLRIRRDRNIDEISHLDLPVSMLSANSARMGGGRNAARHPA
jgi:hypothetical protein